MNLRLIGIIVLGFVFGATLTFFLKPGLQETSPENASDPLPQTTEFNIPEGPSLANSTPQTDAPIYFFLFTHTEDHINHELSEERYERGAALIESLAPQEPSLVWTIQFMGADAESIAARTAETGIVALLTDLADQGFVEFGYHAHHDPTYMNRPQNQLSSTPSYEEVYDALTEWITCQKDPLYGGCVASEGGGLQAIESTFGPVQVVSGLGIGQGVQIERSAGVIAVEDQTETRWLGFGFPDHGATQKMQGYSENRMALFSILTPTLETTSSLFWMDNVVRVNDGIPLQDLNSIKVQEGADSIATTLAQIDRSRPNTLNVGFVDKYIYTVDSTSPTKWAYSHPDSPELPEDLTNSTATIEKNYALAEEGLTYLVETFLPENPGSRFVSSQDLFELVTSDDYFELTTEEINLMALWLLNEWASRPPAYAYDGEDFYSLTDAFMILAHALQGRSTTELVSSYFGAWELPTSESDSVTITAEDLTTAVESMNLEPRFIEESYSVGDHSLTPGQLLYAMAYVYAATHEGVEVESFSIPATATLPETYALLEALGCTACADTAWSLKPARFQD